MKFSCGKWKDRSLKKRGGLECRFIFRKIRFRKDKEFEGLEIHFLKIIRGLILFRKYYRYRSLKLVPSTGCFYLLASVNVLNIFLLHDLVMVSPLLERVHFSSQILQTGSCFSGLSRVSLLL